MALSQSRKRMVGRIVPPSFHPLPDSDRSSERASSDRGRSGNSPPRIPQLKQRGGTPKGGWPISIRFIFGGNFLEPGRVQHSDSNEFGLATSIFSIFIPRGFGDPCRVWRCIDASQVEDRFRCLLRKSAIYSSTRTNSERRTAGDSNFPFSRFKFRCRL